MLLIVGALVLVVVLAVAFMVVSRAATSDRVKASHAAIDRQNQVFEKMDAAWKKGD